MLHLQIYQSSKNLKYNNQTYTLPENNSESEDSRATRYHYFKKRNGENVDKIQQSVKIRNDIHLQLPVGDIYTFL